MKSYERSTKKKIATVKPKQLQLKVPNNKNGVAKWKTISNIILNHRTTEANDFWFITEQENGIEIQFGKEKLIELQNAINGIPKGNGDFAISDSKRKHFLYFWWNLENEIEKVR